MPWMYIVFNLQSARLRSLYNFEMIHIFWSTVTTLPCYYLHDQDFDIFPRNFWARADIFVGRLHFALSKVDVLEDWVWLFGPRSLCSWAFGKNGDIGTGPTFLARLFKLREQIRPTPLTCPLQNYWHSDTPVFVFRTPVRLFVRRSIFLHSNIC